MEAFGEAAFVRLLNRACDGRYLFADKDGRGVSLDPRRTLLNTVWAVERPPSAQVRLRGAYGFYLSESAATVTQDVFDELPAGAILWQPIAVGDDVVMLRAASSQRLLRASASRFPLWQGSVTVDAPENICSGMLWRVQAVLERPTRPFLPVPTEHRDVGTRDIRYAEGAEEDSSVGGDDAWRAMQYHDRSVMMLRRELAQQLQVTLHPLLIICAKAGRHGALTPLLIDLPRGSRPMDFVMVRIYTRVADSFRYPNCDA